MVNDPELKASFGLVPRSANELVDLPLQYRWEFTRRHPYYQLSWQIARKYRRNEFAPGSIENDMGLVAMHLLGIIGVTGMPADPTLSFEELGDTDPSLLSGSVQPMTLRNMLTLLIRALSPKELETVRAILEVAFNPEYAIEGDEELTLQKRKAQLYLTQIASSRFDSYPDIPLYYIHLDASQRRIREDVEELVRRWKHRRQIPERRIHIQEFKNYLAVWDLREGWQDGSYRVEAEQSFPAISAKLDKPKSSVVNAYRAAFQRIIGQEFSQENWLRVMGAFRLTSDIDAAGRTVMARYRRLMNSNRPTPVPETVLQGKPVEHGQVGIIENESAVTGEQANIDLELDLQSLTDRGLRDEEIASELELRSVSTVTYFRERLAEMKGDH